MTDITTKVREHYNATGLTDRIKSALATITPEDQILSIAQPERSRHRRIGCRCAIHPRARSWL
jgi:hypothetical protein